jgi:hypothetical protein
LLEQADADLFREAGDLHFDAVGAEGDGGLRFRPDLGGKAGVDRALEVGGGERGESKS